MYTGNVVEAKDKVVADFGTIIEDTEKLLQATAGEAGEKVLAARARVQESIDAVKQKIDAAEKRAAGKIKAGDGYVREHAWTAIGAAAAIGALIGMLIARR